MPHYTKKASYGAGGLSRLTHDMTPALLHDYFRPAAKAADSIKHRMEQAASAA